MESFGSQSGPHVIEEDDEEGGRKGDRKGGRKGQRKGEVKEAGGGEMRRVRPTGSSVKALTNARNKSQTKTKAKVRFVATTLADHGSNKVKVGGQGGVKSGMGGSVNFKDRTKKKVSAKKKVSPRDTAMTTTAVCTVVLSTIVDTRYPYIPTQHFVTLNDTRYTLTRRTFPARPSPDIREHQEVEEALRAKEPQGQRRLALRRRAQLQLLSFPTLPLLRFDV